MEELKLLSYKERQSIPASCNLLETLLTYKIDKEERVISTFTRTKTRHYIAAVILFHVKCVFPLPSVQKPASLKGFESLAFVVKTLPVVGVLF